MRIIHTSDWHLGHQLLGISRQFEQQQFLDWLFTQLQLHKVDAWYCGARAWRGKP